MKWTAICSATQANAGSWRQTNHDIENKVREEVRLEFLAMMSMSQLSEFFNVQSPPFRVIQNFISNHFFLIKIELCF